MLDLKMKLEELDLVMKTVKNATSLEPQYCLNRMKQQSYENDKLEDMIVRKEKQNYSIRKQFDHGAIIHKTLIDNVYEDVLKRREQIAEFEQQLSDINEEKTKIDMDMRDCGDIICMLRYAFQHYMDMLNHVGDEHMPEKKKYPTTELALPLLKFPGQTVFKKPPSPREDDVEPLIKITRNRIEMLMKKFDSNVVALAKASQMYHTDIIKSLTVEELEAEEVVDARKFFTFILHLL